MKKGIIIGIVVIVIAVIVGIVMLNKNNTPTVNESVEKNKSSFSININNKKFNLGNNLSDLNLPETDEIYEIDSCAFEGKEKTYTYDNFEITTYPHDNKEEIISVYFLNSEMTTEEGIKIGDTVELMKEKYGENFNQADNSYVYTNGDTTLTFIVNNNLITNIEYDLIMN